MDSRAEGPLCSFDVVSVSIADKRVSADPDHVSSLDLTKLSLSTYCVSLFRYFVLLVANCDHARACLLSLDFEARPAGVVDADKFRKFISDNTNDLFDTEDAPALLDVIRACARHDAPVVVP